MLQQLRFGRGLDNRKLKATGFDYRYTTRETVQKLAEHMRLHPVLRGLQEPYRYEREVEDFLRWSPYVRNPTYRKEGRLDPAEAVELQKMLSSYGDRLGGGSTSLLQQSQAAFRAAEAHPPETKGADAANGGAAPTSAIEHYDDLEADEIVGLVDSLENDDLAALLDYERAHLARARVISALEGVLARRRTGDRG
jgi:hypothetical protein